MGDPANATRAGGARRARRPGQPADRQGSFHGGKPMSAYLIVGVRMSDPVAYEQYKVKGRR